MFLFKLLTVHAQNKINRLRLGRKDFFKNSFQGHKAFYFFYCFLSMILQSTICVQQNVTREVCLFVFKKLFL